MVLIGISPANINRVGQNHTFLGTNGVHTVFLAGESPYIRSYGAYIRFWPTLNIKENRCKT